MPPAPPQRPGRRPHTPCYAGCGANYPPCYQTGGFGPDQALRVTTDRRAAVGSGFQTCVIVTFRPTEVGSALSCRYRCIMIVLSFDGSRETDQNHAQTSGLKPRQKCRGFSYFSDLDMLLQVRLNTGHFRKMLCISFSQTELLAAAQRVVPAMVAPARPGCDASLSPHRSAIRIPPGHPL